jgi:hypothetical protein
MSPDVSAMWGQFTGAPNAGPWTLTKGGQFPQAPVPYTPPSPMPNLNAPDYSKTFSAIAKGGLAIGAAGRDIGGYRSEKAMGKVAEKIASREAYQITQKGLKNASAVRAITGAQGTTGAGSPLLAELQHIQAATTDARTRLYQGNIEKYYADQKAKNYLYKAPADLLAALLQGSELFKEKP